MGPRHNGAMRGLLSTGASGRSDCTPRMPPTASAKAPGFLTNDHTSDDRSNAGELGGDEALSEEQS